MDAPKVPAGRARSTKVIKTSPVYVVLPISTVALLLVLVVNTDRVALAPLEVVAATVLRSRTLAATVLRGSSCWCCCKSCVRILIITLIVVLVIAMLVTSSTALRGPRGSSLWSVVLTQAPAVLPAVAVALIALRPGLSFEKTTSRSGSGHCPAVTRAPPGVSALRRACPSERAVAAPAGSPRRATRFPAPKMIFCLYVLLICCLLISARHWLRRPSRLG